jgi:hypothetical protein
MARKKDGQETKPGRPTGFPAAAEDDPIYKEGWTITSIRDTPRPAAPEATGTGMDHRDRWPEEIRIIHQEGPFSVDELKQLKQLQLIDYYYCTSWVLRQEGRDGFIADREMMRDFFIGRMSRGLRLRPDVE